MIKNLQTSQKNIKYDENNVKRKNNMLIAKG